MINVLNLFKIKGKIDINFRDNLDSNMPAMTQHAKCNSDENDNIYSVLINMEILNKFKKYFHELSQALILHELSHIKYYSFEGNSYNNNLIQYVDNLLEDTRVEYNLSLEYPMAVKYFSLALKLFKSDIIIDSDDKIDKIDILMKQIYDFIRYDIMPLDKDLKNYIVPVLISSRRGDRTNSIRCAKIVYRFLLYKSEMIGKDNNDINIKLENKVLKDLDANNETLKDEIDKEVKEMKKGEKGKKAKKEKIKIEKYNKFVHETVQTNMQIILEIEKIFKKILNKSLNVYVKEGEMPTDINKLQQLYLNSFTYDEEKTYINKLRIETELDVLFLRDISWSISSFKNQYAEMLIILLQSLSRFKYVRTASIDFGEYAKITKKFDDKIPNISPISDGTTNLTAALNIASTDKSVMFKSKNKLLIILTDGEPNSIKNVYEELEKEYFNNNVRILPIIIKNDDVYFIKNQIHINEISEMPLKIFDFVKDNFRIEVNI